MTRSEIVNFPHGGRRGKAEVFFVCVELECFRLERIYLLGGPVGV